MQNLSKLHIRGMVCYRCILVIRNELEESGINAVKIDLGEITVTATSQEIEHIRLDERLKMLGFEIMEDRNVKTVKEIKGLVDEVYSGNYEFPLHFRFSDLVRNKLHKDYRSTSEIFARMEQITLEKYIMHYRIEKTRNFLLFTTLALSDIAFKLNYSSVAHLSRQFKQYTGFAPSYTKK